MTRRNQYDRQRGFTLPELLVALLVFSLLATAAVYSLRLGIESRDQLSAADDRLAELEIARVIIKEDLAQVIARPVRDEYGASTGPAFQGGIEINQAQNDPDETILLTFVRNGWSNPNGDAPRSDLQYVSYVEKDGALIRRMRPFLDNARGQPRFDRTLVTDARDLQVEFLAGEIRGELEWVNGWPAPGASGAPPRAVAIEFTKERYGALRQYFWIGALEGGV